MSTEEQNAGNNKDGSRPCPHCRGEISVLADTCMFCGKPVPKILKNKKELVLKGEEVREGEYSPSTHFAEALGSFDIDDAAAKKKSKIVQGNIIVGSSVKKKPVKQASKVSKYNAPSITSLLSPLKWLFVLALFILIVPPLVWLGFRLSNNALMLNAGVVRNASDYFVTTEGHGIRYQIADNCKNGFQDYAWVVSQHTDEMDDFVFTLNGEKSGTHLSNSLWGARNFSWENKEYCIFRGGAPRGRQGVTYCNMMLPNSFVSGDAWTIHNREYSVTHVGQTIVGRNTFPDCVRINVKDTSKHDAGVGHFVLARDVGVIEVWFQRTEDRSVVSYEYIQHQQFFPNTISGTVSVNGRYFTGKVVQIHNVPWGIQSVINASGYFELQAYGPVITLRIGDYYAPDNRLEHRIPGWPKEYNVTGINGNTSVNIVY